MLQFILFNHTIILNSSKLKPNTRQQLNMFSFTPSADDAENTPFFEDNEEKPSLFNSQASQEPSAFDLFNNVSITSHYIQSNYQVEKEKGRSSKKSIIMELDQFDRREALNNLNQNVEQQSFYSQANLKSPQKNSMAESVVRKFQSNQVFPNPQPIKWPKLKDKQEKTQQSGSSFQLNLNQDKKQKQKPQLFSKLSLGVKNFPGLEFKGPRISGKQEVKTIQQAQKGMPQKQAPTSNSIRIEEPAQKANLKTINGFKISAIPPSNQARQQKRQEQESKPTENIYKKPSFQDIKPQKSKPDNDTKSSKQFCFNPLSFQSIFKQQTTDMKSSKVSIGPVEKKQQVKPPNSDSVEPVQNGNLKINFSNILKKSRISENEGKSQYGKINQNNSLFNTGTENQKDHFNNENKLDRSNKPNVQLPNLNIKNLDEKTDVKEQKSEIKTEHTNRQLIKTTNFQNKVENTKKQEPSLLPSKVNKIKQKPCLNLKLLKESTKTQHKMEVQKKIETNNLIKQQQMNRRQDNSTAKLLKNIVFNNGASGLSFQAAGLTKPTKETEQAKKTQQTPKITKIEQKSIKLMGNRQTEKLKQEQHKTYQKPCEESVNPSDESIHRVDFQKYEKQIDLLQDEIEQTKKKYSCCDEGFKDIFLLLNRANTMLSEKYTSQTQANDTKQKTQ